MASRGRSEQQAVHGDEQQHRVVLLLGSNQEETYELFVVGCTGQRGIQRGAMAGDIGERAKSTRHLSQIGHERNRTGRVIPIESWQHGVPLWICSPNSTPVV
jgi:hypothetical protein